MAKHPKPHRHRHTLADLLDDPLIQSMMRADKVHPARIRALYCNFLRARQRQRLATGSAAKVAGPVVPFKQRPPADAPRTFDPFDTSEWLQGGGHHDDRLTA